LADSKSTPSATPSNASFAKETDSKPPIITADKNNTNARKAGT
jgi:hypothetical protein